MALIVLASAAGSPGVTALALGLTLSWPRSVILVDADPGAHQAVLAGFLGGRVRTGKGLQRVAEAHRDRRPLREVVVDQTIALTAESPESDGGTTEDQVERAPSRRLLPGFARPGSASLFAAVWADLADTFATLGDTGIDIVVDAGRLGPHGLPQPLVERADVCALLTRTSLRALAAARGAAAVLVEQGRLSGAVDHLGVVIVGEGRPYGGREISKLLGLPILTAVPDDAASASSLVDGTPRARRFDSAPLPRALPRIVAELQSSLRRRSVQLGVQPPASGSAGDGSASVASVQTDVVGDEGVRV